MRFFVRPSSAATAALAVFLGGVAPAVAAVVSVPAARDTSMMENSPGNSCAIGNVYAGETRFALSRRALIFFDVASYVPAGSTINGAELRLNILRAGSSAAATDVYRLHRLQADWGESSGVDASTCFGGSGAAAAPKDATWSHRFWPLTTWVNAGGDFAAVASAAAATPTFGPAVWPSGSGLVADVQSWLDAPAGNFGWIVIGEESSPTNAREFVSRDGAPAPELVIDFTAPALTPPAVPDGRFAPPLRIGRLSADGGDLRVEWDATHCTSNPQHNLVYGTRPGFPASLGGTYALQGAVCAIGAGSPFDWLGSPDPAVLDPAARLIWMLVVAHDDQTTEGSWGLTTPLEERSGPGTNGSSSVCGILDKSLANVCGQEF